MTLPAVRGAERKEIALQGALEHLAPGPWLERPDAPDAVVTAVRRLPPVDARYAPFPHGLDPRLQAAFERRGVTQLYSHQADALTHVAAGRNIVVTTPTASGKTLCYNLPVLDAVLQNPAVRALYLFPTKALAQDQMAEIHGLVNEIGDAAGGPDRRAHLRRRYTAGCAADHPHARACRAHQPGHAALGHPAASSALGEAVREPPLRRDRRAARLSRRVRQSLVQRPAPAAPHRRATTDRIRNSSARRPRSRIRASWPSGWRSGRSSTSPRVAPRAARSSSSSSIRRS